MGRCPFGFTGDEEEQEQEQLEQVQGDGAEPADVAAAGGVYDDKKKRKKEKIKVPGKFDAEKDPVSWFYSNQIKSEAEFQAKKEVMHAEARTRLKHIMDKKNQRLEWPSDSEFEDLSISSAELSELDSDVHSLASVRTCAYSWIEQKRYKMPAETTACWVATGALGLAFVGMACAVQAIQALRPLQGAVRNSEWPGYLFLCALGLSGSAGCLLLASSWRSRKLLLAAGAGALLAYGATVMLAVAISSLPCEVDALEHKTLCGGTRQGGSQSGTAAAPWCDNLVTAQEAVTKSTASFKGVTATLAVACLAMCGVGTWYLFELCYVEKKGVKHMRRHRRNKFTIPWDKIKIVGPPLPCGGPAPHAKHGTARSGGGKCPVGFS